MFSKNAVALAIAVTAFLVPAASQARGSFGFSINSGPAYYAPVPAPVYVAPLPPPPPPVYYGPAYGYGYRPYYRPAPAFGFSYYGR